MKKILSGVIALFLALSASAQIYTRTASGVDTNSVIGISAGLLGTNTFGQIQMPGPTAWTTNWVGGTIGCVSNMVTAFTNGVLSWGTTGALQVLTAGFYDIGYNVSFVDAASASTMRVDVFTNVAGGSLTSIGGGTHATASTTTYGIWSRPSAIRYLPANTIVSLAMHRIAGTAGGGTISNASLSVVMLRNSTAGGTGGSSTNTASTITNVLWGNTLFVDAANGDDATGMRGDATKPYRTVRGAWTNALRTTVGGDLIYVRPGWYSTTNTLAKSNVNWYVSAGATIAMTNIYNITNSGTPRSLWDDADEALRCSIDGYGDFIYDAGTQTVDSVTFFKNDSNTGIKGAIYLQNSNTVFNFRGRSLQMRSYHSPPVEPSAVWIVNASNVVITLDEIRDLGFGVQLQIGVDEFTDPVMADSSSSGLYWELGECYFNCGIVQAARYPIYASQPAGSTHRANLWARCGYLTNTAVTSVIYTSGGGTSLGWKTWIDVLAAESGVGPAYSGYANGSHYLRAQKLMGTTGLQLVDTGAGNNRFWCDVQKITATLTAAIDCTAANSGTFFDMTVHHLEATGATSRLVDFSSGAGVLRGGRGSINGRGILHDGGKFRVEGYTFDTSAGTNAAVWVNNSGLTLKDCTLITTNTHFTITTSVATNNNVTILGSHGTTDATNKINVLVGPWTHDTNLITP